MSVEQLLEIVGSNGRYQYRLFGFIFFTTFMCGINYYTQVFIFAAPPHDCSTLLSRKNMTIGDEESGQYFYGDDNGIRKGVIAYDYTSLFPTLTSDHHWVCENDKNPAIAHQLFWSGNIVGYIFWGYTNDNFGRRPTVLMSHLAYFFGGLMTLISWNFWMIGISRFVVGMAHHTVSHLPYLIAVEYCGVKNRTYPLLAVMASYTSASLAIPLLAKILPAWRSMKMIAVFPNLLVIGAYFVGWIPESLSWLICKGQMDRARTALNTVAKINGKNLEDKTELISKLLQDIQTEASATDLENEKTFESYQIVEKSGQQMRRFKRFIQQCSSRFLKRAILAFVITFIGFVSYYGHASNTSNLGKDMHLSFIFAALVEVPAFSIPFIINYNGRRWTLFTAFLAAGAASIFYAFVPADNESLRMSSAMFGRMFATGAYYICLQYASEIFPTSIRGSGLSACEIIGGIGLFMSPWIVYLAKYEAELPLLVFGAISLLGSVATFFLPETCNRALPSTVNDANNFEVNQKYLDCMLCSKQSNDEEEVEKGEIEDSLLISAKVVECENLDSISLRQLTITT